MHVTKTIDVELQNDDLVRLIGELDVLAKLQLLSMVLLDEADIDRIIEYFPLCAATLDRLPERYRAAADTIERSLKKAAARKGTDE